MITNAEIAQQWAANLKLTALLFERTILGFSLFGVDGRAILPELLPEDIRKLSAYDLASFAFLKNKVENEAISIVEIARIAPVPETLKENGDSICVLWDVDFDTDKWGFEAIDGERAISKLLIDLEFRIRAVPAPIQSVKQYSSNDQALYHLVKGIARDDNCTDLLLTWMDWCQLTKKCHT